MELAPDREEARQLYRERIMAIIAGTAIAQTNQQPQGNRR